jgi:hypothetical protein
MNERCSYPPRPNPCPNTEANGNELHHAKDKLSGPTRAVITEEGIVGLVNAASITSSVALWMPNCVKESNSWLVVTNPAPSIPERIAAVLYWPKTTMARCLRKDAFALHSA